MIGCATKYLYSDWANQHSHISTMNGPFRYGYSGLPKLAFNTSLYPFLIPTSHSFVGTTVVVRRFKSENLSVKFTSPSARIIVCTILFQSRSHWSAESENPLVLFVCFSFWIWAPAARCKCGRPFRFSRSIDSGAAARDDGWLQAFPPVSFVNAKNPRLILIWQLCVEWAP